MTRPRKYLFRRNHWNFSIHAPWLLKGSVIAIMTLLFLISCKAEPNSRTPSSTDTSSTALPAATSTWNFLPLTTPTFVILPNLDPDQPLEVDISLYTHPQDFYSLRAPLNWQVNQVSSSVLFTEPQGEPNIYVTVVNTGYPLDHDSFTRLVEIQEKKKSSEQESYIEIERGESPQDNSITITKSFYDHEIVNRGTTYYRQFDRVVFIADYWVKDELYEDYKNLFRSMYSSMNLDVDAVAALPVYSFEQARKHTNGHFSFLLPPYWSINRTEEEYAVVETFMSPDENAVIQTLIYDDGQPISKAVAAELALNLLSDNYSKNITVSRDEVIQDGREKLTWRSKVSNYQGITSFMVRETGVFILTVMWDSDYTRYYETILEDVFLSYQLEGLEE